MPEKGLKKVDIAVKESMITKIKEEIIEDAGEIV